MWNIYPCGCRVTWYSCWSIWCGTIRRTNHWWAVMRLSVLPSFSFFGLHLSFCLSSAICVMDIHFSWWRVWYLPRSVTSFDNILIKVGGLEGVQFLLSCSQLTWQCLSHVSFFRLTHSFFLSLFLYLFISFGLCLSVLIPFLGDVSSLPNPTQDEFDVWRCQWHLVTTF